MSAVQTMINTEEQKMTQLPMDVVYRFLEETYSLERAEAEELLKKALSKPKTSKKKTEKKKAVEDLPQPDVALPFCKVGVENQCTAVVLNNQLFTQCTHVVAGELDCSGKKISLCKACLKGAKTRVKAGNRALSYGTIEERMENGGVYGNNGALRKPVSYASVMSKLNITKEAAEAAAEKMGWTIPEEEFAAKPTARGRPKKSKKTAVEAVADTSESETEGEKTAAKKRGRPKKEKKVMANADGEDLIANLVEEAQRKGGETGAATSDEESSGSEMDNIQKGTDEIVRKQAAVMAGLPKETWKPTAKKAPVGNAAQAKKDAAAAKKAEKAAAAAAKKEEKAAAAAAKKKEKAAAAAAKKEEKAAAAAAKKAEKAAKGKSTKKETSAVAPPEADELVEEPESDDEVTQVVKWTCPADGKEYLLAGDNIVYDKETHEPVGTWNEEQQKLEEVEVECEEEE